MWVGASETKEMKLNKWLELSRKWREMNKELNKTPNTITPRASLSRRPLWAEDPYSSVSRYILKALTFIGTFGHQHFA